MAGGVALTTTTWAVAGGVLSLTLAGWILFHLPKGDIADGPSYWLPGVPAENASGEDNKENAPPTPATSTPADPSQHDPEGDPTKRGGTGQRPEKPSYEIGASDGGPGKWILKKESMSEAAAAYQEKVTGAPRGTTYDVPNPLTTTGKTNFDGYFPSTNTLVDAKLLIDWPRADVPFSFNNFVIQARSQVEAAKASGANVAWAVPSQQMVDLLDFVFQENGLGGKIKLYVVEP